jgi:glucose-6-phosphate-specific signal transduction histidine kinase
LRLVLLLVLPYRFWPAQAAGELASLGAVAIECGPLYGWGWAAFRAVPTVVLAMPIVRAFRNRWPRLGDKVSANVAPLLACTLVVSAVWAAYSLVIFSMLRTPAGYVSPPYHLLAERYFLGQCVGIITLTPLLLWLNEARHKSTWRELWNEFVSSRLALESTVILVPSLFFLTWLAIRGSDEIAQIARMAMFLPVAALTLRNGWRGAAIGSALASICVIIAMPAARDPGTVAAQAFIALTSGILLLLGSRISALHSREQQERIDERRAIQLAQSSILQSERRLHQAAEALEDMRDIMAVSQDYIFDRFQRLLSPAEQRGFRRDEAGVAYRCDVQNRAPGQLGAALPIALYRLACEAALHLCTQYHSKRIHLRLRVGVTGERVWALMSIEGGEAANEPFIRGSMLQRHLGASGMDLEALRGQAKVYGGNVRMRSTEGRPRITLLLTEAEVAKTAEARYSN